MRAPLYVKKSITQEAESKQLRLALSVVDDPGTLFDPLAQGTAVEHVLQMDRGQLSQTFLFYSDGIPPSNTRRRPNVVLMLAHRLRRQASSKTTLGQRLVSAWIRSVDDLIDFGGIFRDDSPAKTTYWANVGPTSRTVAQR